MGDNDDSISRRKFLEQASVAVGAAALGAACSSDETGPEQPASESPPSPAGGAGSPTDAAGTGSAAGSGGSGGSPRTGGTAGARANAGAGNGAAGSSEAGGGAAGTSATANEAGTDASGSGGTSAMPPPAAGGKVRVGIVSRDNVEEAVARAVELAGGLDEIQPGQTVFIKPNLVSDRAIGMAGIRTSNEVVAAVVKLVKTRNPGRIIVGDRSARQFPDTARVVAMTGVGEAAMMAGADEIYAGKSPEEAPEEWVLLQPPGYEETWGSRGGLMAMKKILDADHLINVPTCKNHRYALFSLSMKNFMGAIGDDSRVPVHFGDSIAGSFGPIGRDMAIINEMFNPLMNIIDAQTALVNGGPQGDGADAVRTTPGLIFASKDRIAIDAAAASLIQLELETAMVRTPDASNAVLKRETAWNLAQITAGITAGLGVSTADMVTLEFDGVMRSAEIEAKFRAT